jgi:hypothetical protein
MIFIPAVALASFVVPLVRTLRSRTARAKLDSSRRFYAFFKQVLDFRRVSFPWGPRNHLKTSNLAIKVAKINDLVVHFHDLHRFRGNNAPDCGDGSKRRTAPVRLLNRVAESVILPLLATKTSVAISEK